MNQPSKVQIPEGEGGRKSQCAPKHRNKEIILIDCETMQTCALLTVPSSMCVFPHLSLSWPALLPLSVTRLPVYFS